MVETATSGLFDNVNWDDIEAQEDVKQEIPFLKGDYIGEIIECKEIEWADGVFCSMKIKVTETVTPNAINGVNRRLDKNLSIGEAWGKSASENTDILLKAFKTIGAKNMEDAIGKTVYMKVEPNGTKRDDLGWPKQKVTLVKEFKGATDDVNVAEGGDNKIPF